MGVVALLATALTVSAPPAPPEHAFALLVDNRLVEIAVPSGRVVARRRLGPRPQGYVTEGSFLAASEGDRRLFALVQTGTGADWVAVLDSRTARVRGRYELEAGVRYRGIALAGDLLYAYGGRYGREVDKTDHLREESAVLTQLDAANGQIRASLTVRPAEGHMWWVYWAAAATGANRIALSYHGGCGPDSTGLCTTGADWVDVAGTSLRRCELQASKSVLACMPQAHGMIESYGVGWIATTGEESLVQYGPRGNLLRRLHTGIHRDHVMNFAFSPERNRLYVLSSCGYSHEGLRQISLTGGPPKIVGGKLCGDRVVVGRKAFVVERTKTLEVRESRTAKLLHSTRLPTDVFDVVVVG